MFYPLVLLLHIGAACITIGLGAYAMYTLWQDRNTAYRSLALAIGAITAFEVITGTMLAVLSPELSAVYLSTHIAVYVGACLVVETLLFVRMQRVTLVFPLKLAASPVLASLVLFVGAFVAGF